VERHPRQDGTRQGAAVSWPQYGVECLPSHTTFFGTKTEPPGLIGGWHCPCSCHHVTGGSMAETIKPPTAKGEQS
jgi:hypothetical protein